MINHSTVHCSAVVLFIIIIIIICSLDSVTATHS